jgi:hypothetical protein
MIRVYPYPITLQYLIPPITGEKSRDRVNSGIDLETYTAGFPDHIPLLSLSGEFLPGSYPKQTGIT